VDVKTIALGALGIGAVGFIAYRLSRQGQTTVVQGGGGGGGPSPQEMAQLAQQAQAPALQAVSSLQEGILGLARQYQQESASTKDMIAKMQQQTAQMIAAQTQTFGQALEKIAQMQTALGDKMAQQIASVISSQQQFQQQLVSQIQQSATSSRSTLDSVLSGFGQVIGAVMAKPSTTQPVTTQQTTTKPATAAPTTSSSTTISQQELARLQSLASGPVPLIPGAKYAETDRYIYVSSNDPHNQVSMMIPKKENPATWNPQGTLIPGSHEQIISPSQMAPGSTTTYPYGGQTVVKALTGDSKTSTFSVGGQNYVVNKSSGTVTSNGQVVAYTKTVAAGIQDVYDTSGKRLGSLDTSYNTFTVQPPPGPPVYNNH
jgi:hypothetical protein